MIDIETGADVSISHAEHYIHKGTSFKVDDIVQVDTGTQLWLITTPDSLKYAHTVFDILCTGEMTILVTEGADRTTGDALMPINRRRVGTPTAATVTVKRGATGGGTNGAVTIKNLRIGATDKFSAATGDAPGRREYILKPSTKYVVSVTTYADNVFVTLRLHWCECKDRQMQEHYNVER